MGPNDSVKAAAALTALALALSGCASDGTPGGTRNPDTSGGAGSGVSNDPTASSAGSGGAATAAGAGAGSDPSAPLAGGSSGSDSGNTGATGAEPSEPAGSDTSSVDCDALTLPENFDDVIATFEDATGATNQVEGRGGGFFMFNDTTGTQEPPPGDLPPAEMVSRCDSLYALCTSGSGFTDWGAGMGTDLGPTDADGNKMPFDASEYSGIAFWARAGEGSTPVVRVSLKDANTAPEGGICDENETSGATACNDDWGKSLNLTREWKAYTIQFDELRQAGWGAAYDQFEQSAVYGIQWQIGPNLDFDLCIDDLMLVR